LKSDGEQTNGGAQPNGEAEQKDEEEQKKEVSLLPIWDKQMEVQHGRPLELLKLKLQ
jgi:hypothetical protein